MVHIDDGNTLGGTCCAVILFDFRSLILNEMARTFPSFFAPSFFALLSCFTVILFHRVQHLLYLMFRVLVWAFLRPRPRHTIRYRPVGSLIHGKVPQAWKTEWLWPCRFLKWINWPWSPRPVRTIGSKTYPGPTKPGPM